MITCDPTLLMQKQTLNESHHSEILDHQKSIVYAKRRTRTVATKIEPEPIHMTRRTTRKQKPIKEIETNKRQTRKRKQSISDDGNNNNNTVALRKKKAVDPPPAKTNTRKTRVKKTKRNTYSRTITITYHRSIKTL